MSFTFTFSSRDFRSHVLRLKAANGDETQLKVHPLLLSHSSPFFDKVVFPFENEESFVFGRAVSDHALEEKNNSEMSNIASSGSAKSSKKKSSICQPQQQDLSLSVFDVWAVADVINSFYGETTNIGSRPKWERDIKFAQAKDFLLVEKMNMDVFLKEIPKTAVDFDRYLSLALDENNAWSAENRDSFLEKFSQKVGDFYRYFEKDFVKIMATLKDKKAVSPGLVKNLVSGLPFEDVTVFESLIGIIEMCSKEEVLLADIWEDLDFAIGEKYPQVSQDCRLRYEKLGFKKSGDKTPTNIVGMVSDRVLSFSLTEESPAVIYGASVSAKGFFIREDKIVLGTTSGVISCDQKGKETAICEHFKNNIITIKNLRGMIVTTDSTQINVINIKTDSKIWGQSKKYNSVSDDKGNFYCIENSKIVKQKIGVSTCTEYPTALPHSYRSYPPDIKVSKRGGFVVFYDAKNPSHSGTIYLVNTTTSAVKTEAVSIDFERIFFSCCSKYLVTVSAYTPRMTRIFRIDTAGPRLEIHKQHQGVAIATADKRRLLAILEDQKISIYDFEGVQLKQLDVTFGINDKLQALFSDDGSLLAVSSETLTNVYKISTGELVFSRAIRLRDVKFHLI